MLEYIITATVTCAKLCAAAPKTAAPMYENLSVLLIIITIKKNENRLPARLKGNCVSPPYSIVAIIGRTVHIIKVDFTFKMLIHKMVTIFAKPNFPPGIPDIVGKKFSNN